MADPRRLRVFLCHAHGDKPAARDLYRRLQADGVQPWLDEEDLVPGQRWRDEIPRAVRQSDVILVCLSRQSVDRAGFVQREIKVALDAAQEKPEGAIFIIPVRLEECDVPLRLAKYQWVDLFDTRGFERLMRALTLRAAALGIDLQPAPPPPAPPVAPPQTKPASGPTTSQRVADLLAQLEQAEKKSDWDQVIQLGEDTLKLAPNHADARSKTGIAYNKRGIKFHNSQDYTKAIADKTKAIELDPTKADYYWERGKSYHNAAFYGKPGDDYAKAIADKTKAIELDPTKAEYYNSRGISYHTAADYGQPGGDYAKAIADYTKAIELDPTNADYYYSRGLSYKLKGDKAAARRDFQRAADMGHAKAKGELAGLG